MRHSLYLAGLLLLAALPAPAQKVRVAANPKADLSRYRTYQWMPGRISTKHGIVEEGPEVTPAVKAAVNGALQSRGFQEVAQDGEIQVVYWAAAESSPQVEAILWTTWAAPSDFTWGVGGNPVVIGRYNHSGTLALNLIDAKTNQSLWAALCKDTVDKPSDIRKKVAKGVAKAFKQFPVKPVQ